MSGFDKGWLALRARHDGAARQGAASLAAGFAAAVGANPRLLDLAAGTGNNARFLAPMLGRGQTWMLVDNDQALLDGAAAGGPADVTMMARLADLTAVDLDDLIAADVAGVTAAALLDLVSHRWLARLVAATAARRLPLLMSLSVDGRFAWAPADGADDPVMAGFFADLQGDKGFGGAALGALAPAALMAVCGAAGYRVESADTDWVIGGDAPEMLAALVDGVAAAALAQGVTGAAQWRRRRHEGLAAGQLGLTLGHKDVLAVM